jgi:hypothetical protein
MVELPVTPGRVTIMEETGKQSRGQFKHIEIQINTICDCSCFGCDRMSDVITDDSMTVEQVRRFVDESLDLRWEWERIRILGGEPSLHKELNTIVEQLMHYRRFYSKCFLQLLSNGLGKLWKPAPWKPDTSIHDWLCDRGVDPHVEAKERGTTPPWFWNTRIVPFDRDSNCGPLEPCGIFGVRGCGLGLTRQGYFLDGAGAAVARVAGIDCGVMALKDVTWEAMIDQAHKLCKYCGQWNSTEAGVPLSTELVSKTGEITGPFWTEKLAAYNRQRPKMKVYGGA